MGQAVPLRIGRKVLMLTNMYPSADHPDHGVFVKEQVEGVRAQGIEVDVLMVGGLRQKASYLKGALQFLRQVRQKRYDLIHAHYVFCGVIARMQFGTPVLLTHHGIEVLQGWTAPLCWLISRLVNGVVVTSDEMRRALGLPNAHVIPCGVDLALFRPQSQREARERLGLPLKKSLVLFVGLDRPEKRLDVIRTAVATLQEDMPQVQLVLASGLPHDLIPWYMNACDVLVLASDREGSPMAIKEAMACNLPIVSVDAGDVAQVIGTTEGCFLCAQDPSDMVAKLCLALRFGKRTNGRAAVQRLSLTAMVDNLTRVYSELW